jgi:hypothetical protein
MDFRELGLQHVTSAADLVPQTLAQSEQPLPTRGASSVRPPQSGVIDKSVLALPEPHRVRDRDHVKSVAKRPCLICGRRPSVAHHLRCMQRQALGRKVGDEFTVPLCRGHHRELHRCGDETAWWSNAGIDPATAARALWLETHPLPIDQRNGPANTGEDPASDPMDRVTRGIIS